jgi:predicted transcriptional regulator
LLTGGPLPCQVEEQLDRLIEIGVLERMPATAAKLNAGPPALEREL